MPEWWLYLIRQARHISFTSCLHELLDYIFVILFLKLVSFLLENIYPCLKDKNRLFDLALDVTDVPQHGEAKLRPVDYFLDLERHGPH